MASVIRSILLAAAALAAHPDAARAANPQAARASDDTAVFAKVSFRAFETHEEVSIRLTGKGAVLVLNSNFAQTPGTPVQLGHFEAAMNPRLEIEYRELLLRKRRLQAKRLPPSARNLEHITQDHGFRYFIGEEEVGSESPEGRAILALLADPWKFADWKPVKAATVFISDEPGQAAVRELPAGAPGGSRAIACSRHSETVDRCNAEGFGVAYLQRAKRQAGPGGGKPGPPGGGKQRRSQP